MTYFTYLDAAAGEEHEHLLLLGRVHARGLGDGAQRVKLPHDRVRQLLVGSARLAVGLVRLRLRLRVGGGRLRLRVRVRVRVRVRP